MTIQMKATEQYFPVVLFIMLYKVVLTFEPGFKPKLSMIIQTEKLMIEQYFSFSLFIIFYTKCMIF